MRNSIHKILVIVSLMACGSKNDASKLSEKDPIPDNSPVRSDCLGMDAGKNPKAVSVDWDDQSPLRVCLVLQADGAFAFDLRLRTNHPELRRQMANIEVRSPSGRTASGVFPFVWNPYNGIYEMQLSEGCMIGSPDGCAVTAPAEMRRMFSAIAHTEGAWHPEVQMAVSLVNPKSGKSHIEAPRFLFNWNSQTLKLSDKIVN